MTIKDTLSLAYRTVKTNRLRTTITVATIALGLTALVGINTAIKAVEYSMLDSFSSMGASGFTIRFKDRRFEINTGGAQTQKETVGAKKEKKSNLGKPITRRQAEDFKRSFELPSTISISLFGSGNAIITHDGKKSNPNITVAGGDENYLLLNGYKILSGRNFSEPDVISGSNLCIIGSDIVSEYFGGKPESAIGKSIRVEGIAFQVIGTLDSKGSMMGRNFDKLVLVSYVNSRKYFNKSANASYNIGVKMDDVKLLETGVDEATGLFRKIRYLPFDVADNFFIDRSDSLTNTLLSQLIYIRVAAILIGVLTLFSAAINLMNIMLVAVTERTKEIGLVKAIGGKGANVQNQFLFEAIIISLIGAFIGIIFGVTIGNLVGQLMGTGVILPWDWIIAGIIICTLVGLLAGLHPARKAARLNPIEALRYE